MPCSEHNIKKNKFKSVFDIFHCHKLIQARLNRFKLSTHELLVINSMCGYTFLKFSLKSGTKPTRPESVGESDLVTPSLSGTKPTRPSSRLNIYLALSESLDRKCSLQRASIYLQGSHIDVEVYIVSEGSSLATKSHNNVFDLSDILIFCVLRQMQLVSRHRPMIGLAQRILMQPTEIFQDSIQIQCFLIPNMVQQTIQMCLSMMSHK